MYRYEILIDGEPHSVSLCPGEMSRTIGTRSTASGSSMVEFWAEYDPDASLAERRFQVFGTNEQIPAGAVLIGTAPRDVSGFVWHLYEL